MNSASIEWTYDQVLWGLDNFSKFSRRERLLLLEHIRAINWPPLEFPCPRDCHWKLRIMDIRLGPPHITWLKLQIHCLPRKTAPADSSLALPLGHTTLMLAFGGTEPAVPPPVLSSFPQRAGNIATGQ